MRTIVKPKASPHGAVVPRVVVISHWWVNLAPLPFKESDIVITGRVLTANAFLSNDRTNVYSEFSVQIQEVLSNCTNRSLGTTLDVNREGGSIRFPSGQILYRTTSRQGYPRAGETYVLFLKASPVGDPGILTGYRISGGSVMPLDDVPQLKEFSREQDDFLARLRSGTVNSCRDRGSQE